MTEAEWFTSEHPELMLSLHRTDCCGCWWTVNYDSSFSLCAGEKPCRQCDNGPVMPRSLFTDRQLRLFACACVRQVWHLLPHLYSRKAVEVAERCADGEETGIELGIAHAQAELAWQAALEGDDTAPASEAWGASRPSAFDAARFACDIPRPMGRTRTDEANLLREIRGNPYLSQSIRRPLQWIVTNLATAAYEERLPTGLLDPVRLQILADAVEEYLIQPVDSIVEHLRSPGPHVRGCWALDLLLARS